MNGPKKIKRQMKQNFFIIKSENEFTTSSHGRDERQMCNGFIPRKLAMECKTIEGIRICKWDILQPVKNKKNKKKKKN